MLAGARLTGIGGPWLLYTQWLFFYHEYTNKFTETKVKSLHNGLSIIAFKLTIEVCYY